MKEDKIEQMLRAMEHPEDFTDEQLAQLFEDEEVRDCYELTVAAEQFFAGEALCPPVESNVFSNGKRRFLPWKTMFSAREKIAAVFAGLLLMAGIAVAAISLSRTTAGEKPVPEAPAAASRIQADAETLPADTLLTFENVELEAIVGRLASHYRVGVDFRNQEARHLRLYTKWAPAEPLELVVERLNAFEKVNIMEQDKTLIVE